MSIREILESKGQNVETIGADETVKSAADRMREKNIAALVVLERGAIRGLISERDLVNGISVHGAKLLSKNIGEVMSRLILMVKLEDSVKQAMRLMTRYRTRHLLVIGENALAGVVSSGDVVKQRLDELELETNVLRDAYIAAH